MAHLIMLYSIMHICVSMLSCCQHVCVINTQKKISAGQVMTIDYILTGLGPHNFVCKREEPNIFYIAVRADVAMRCSQVAILGILTHHLFTFYTVKLNSFSYIPRDGDTQLLVYTRYIQLTEKKRPRLNGLTNIRMVKYCCDQPSWLNNICMYYNVIISRIRPCVS